MKYLKKFGKFTEAAAAPATKPAPSTTPAPTVEPGTKPERRERLTPVRRDRPAVEPDPQAKLEKANIEDVVENFLIIAKEEGFNFKKYFPKV